MKSFHLWKVAAVTTLLSVIRVRSEVEVILEGEVIGSFVGTRYSNYIGGFEDDCTINAPATLLAPDENPCSRGSIQQNLVGQAVILSFRTNDFGCFEETAYGNLEALGAVAVLNTDPQPAGATLNRINWGKKPNQGNIPLLDLGLEFFEGVFLRVIESGEGVQVNIEGCADHNRFETCINVEQTILNSLSFIPLLPTILAARKALKEIKRTPGTAPRVCLLQFMVGLGTFLAVAALANLASVDGYFIFGGVYPMGVRGIILALFAVAVFYVTLVTVYYWSYLTSKCFHSHDVYGDTFLQRILIKNRRKSFFHRVEFHAINVVAFISLIVFIILLTRPNPEFGNLIRAYIYMDIIILVLLVTTNYRFIAESTKVIKRSSGNAMHTQPAGNMRAKLGEILDNITGKALQKHIKANGADLTASTSASTMRLTLHLGFWIEIYGVLVVLLFFNVEFLTRKVTSFGKLEGDPVMENCMFIIPQIINFALRSLMLLPIVQGIRGPTGLRSGGNSSTPKSHKQESMNILTYPALGSNRSKKQEFVSQRLVYASKNSQPKPSLHLSI